ncbi:cuticle protein AM1199-like [Macrobrachium rosenbergii]|uniref:cuticle protein AM1199-like n=1 Tax=Macrobrachium rosenbergii TaxID=79674 RepID=UPI0034D4AA46
MQALISVLLLTVCTSLGALALRLPRQAQAEVGTATHIPILLDERAPVDTLGGYGFRIQTGNGIDWTESAAPTGPLNQVITSGAYSFTHPDGSVHNMRYTADAAGFHPESSMIPTPFPLEPWQLEQVRFAEEQRRLQAQSGTVA